MSQGSGPGRRGRVAGAWRRVAAAGTAAALAATGVLAGAGAAAAAPRLPVLVFSPAPYDYGQVTAGRAAGQTFMLANAGTKATGRLRVRLAGSAAFTITGDRCHSLGPGKTCTVTVRFAPARAGTVTATLTAASKEHLVTATDVLAGSGRALGAAPGLSFTPAAYDFGTVFTGQTASQAFTLANSGGAATGTLTVSLSSFGSLEFHITSDTCTGPSLAPGQTCTVTVRFAPVGPGGVPTILNAVSNNPAAAATAGIVGAGVAPHIYWADSPNGAGTGAIWEAGLNGSSPQPIISGLRAPLGVAVTSSHLYWTVSGDGTIGEANLDGSSPHTIITGQNKPGGVVADTSHLYWTDIGDGTIWEANLDGTSPHVIIGRQNIPAGVAVDASHLYWTDAANGTPGAGTINEASLDGTSPQPIINGQNGPVGVAVDASHLYWAGLLDGTIWEASLTSPSPQAFITGQPAPSGVAVTSSQLYWTDAGNGTINVINLNGSGSPQTIVTGQKNPQLIAVPPA